MSPFAPRKDSLDTYTYTHFNHLHKHPQPSLMGLKPENNK